ncbi:MAG: ATP-binding protein [Pseudomonadota bacterium]
MHEPPTLHMICGKIASGKSTLAGRLGKSEGTVLVSEDDWLDALFGKEIKTPRDYVACAAKLRRIMGPHISALLTAGVSVVLDFPANTVETRAWMRQILEATEAEHKLHVLDPPDAVCLTRLKARNVSGDHAFAATEAQFREFSRHFVRPAPDEGFRLVIHQTGSG